MNIEGERAGFVAWQKSKGADDHDLRRGYRDDYIWRDVQKQWEAWQERASREGSLPDRANPARDESPKAIEPGRDSDAPR